MATTATPTQLPIKDIEVVKGFNPRSAMDKQKLDELAKSIKNNGLLQPLVVGEKTDKGKYPLIAGHRRFAALKLNRASMVAVSVVDANGNAKALAVTENLQREQVNPIDEANGFAQVMEAESLSQKQLASRLGISTSQVSDRLKLLKLPPAAQTAIAAGKLPTSVTSFIEKIAAVSAEFAEVVSAELVKESADGDVTSLLANRWSVSNLFDSACVSAGKKKIFAVRVDHGIATALKHLSGDTAEEKETLKVLLAGRHDWDVPAKARPDWTTEDDNAARGFKVLVEHKLSQSQSVRIVLDPEFLMDRLTAKRDVYEKARAKAASKKPAGPSEDKIKEQRAAEREEKRKRKLAAQASNDELGHKLRAEYGTAEVTLERIKAIVMMVLNADSYNSTPAGMMAFTTPEFHDQHIKTLKDGREQLKVDLLPASSVDENVKRMVIEATSVEQVLGIFYQVTLSALLVDRESVSPNDRRNHGWTIPGTYEDPEFNPRAHLLRSAIPVVSEDKKVEILKELELMEASGDLGDEEGDRFDPAAEIDTEQVAEAAAAHAEEVASTEPAEDPDQLSIED